jgi:GNAT superfamily N-acetyltransferase
MIISIEKDHEIFKSREYQKDIVPFSLIELIRQYPFLLVSDEKSFVVGMTGPQMPVWVWTSDGISEESLKELSDYLWDRFHGQGSIMLIAKPETADVLVKPFLGKSAAKQHRVCMESFENPRVIPAKNTDVSIERPSPADKKEIAVCMANFQQDCYGKAEDYEDFLQEAGECIENPWFFVIKQQESVVATAQSRRETEKHMAINLVYTKPEYRGRGFAAALVAHISKLILERGKTPILYTDLANPASNRAYQNVGFIKRGKVDEVTLNWN